MSIAGSWGEEDIRAIARQESRADRSLRGLYFVLGFMFGLIVGGYLGGARW